MRRVPIRIVVGIAALSFLLIGDASTARAVDPAFDTFPGPHMNALFDGVLDGTGATVQEGEPTACFGPLTSSIWFRWVPQIFGPGQYEMTAAGAGFVPTIVIWDHGWPPSQDLLYVQGCSVTSVVLPESPNEQRVTFAVKSEVQYYVQIGTQSGALGAIDFKIRKLGESSFDDRATPYVLSMGESAVLDLGSADIEPEEPQPTCSAVPQFAGSIDATMWLQYTSGDTSEHVLFDAYLRDLQPWITVWSNDATPVQLGCGAAVVGITTEPNTTYLVQVGRQKFFDGPVVTGRVEVYIHSFSDLICPSGPGVRFRDTLSDAEGQGQPLSEIESVRINTGVDVTCLTFTYQQTVSTFQDPGNMLDSNVYIDDMFGDGPPFDEFFCSSSEPFNPNHQIYVAGGMGSNVAALFRDRQWQPDATPPWATFSLAGDEITIAVLTDFLGQGYAFRLNAVAGNNEDMTDCAPDEGVWEYKATINPFVGDLDCNAAVEPGDILPLMAQVSQLDLGSDGCPSIGVPVEAPISVGGTVMSNFSFGDFNCDGVVDLQDALFLLTWADDNGPPADGCWDLESHVIPD